MLVRRIVSAAFVISVSLGPAAGVAAACLVCDTSLQCVEHSPGAKFCIQSTLTCSMAFPCYKAGGQVPDPMESGLTAVTLFDAERSLAPAIEPDAGPLAVGEAARATRGAERGAIAEAMLAHGTDFAVRFVDALGGGFALRRHEAGGAVRLEVLDLVAGEPGRVLAEGVLREQDRLVATVQVEGRPRTLVLQAARLPAPAVEPAVTRLRQSIQEAARALPPRERPLLELREL